MKFFLLVLLLNMAIFANEAERGEYSAPEGYEHEMADELDAKHSMDNWLSGLFGLQPYKVNYLLPYGYSTKVYKSYTPTDKYMNSEAELQISLKLNVGNDLFGLGESYYLSYSHVAFWQTYAESSPFRETNYNPEGFVVFPVDDDIFNIKAIKFALAHKSNGQGSNREVVYTNPEDNLGNRSRSINYVYSTLRLQHGTLLSDFTVMTLLPEDDETNDNPDIMDYYGYGELKLSYFSGKHMYTLMGRGNPSHGHGAVEGTYSYPLLKSAYLYTKIFSGYGESLIDYNNEINKFSIGFSFSR